MKPNPKTNLSNVNDIYKYIVKLIYTSNQQKKLQITHFQESLLSSVQPILLSKLVHSNPNTLAIKTNQKTKKFNKYKMNHSILDVISQSNFHSTKRK
jgi:hypothetical protein